MDHINYGVSSPEAVANLDGLAFLKGIIDGTLPAPPIAKMMEYSLTEAEAGRAVFECVPQFEHYNPIGVVHGGLAMTLLDSALACAIHTTLAKGEAYTTLEIKVNLTRAITKDTGLIRATGRVLHRGRTIATSEGDIRDAKGTLYAHATTTCLVFELPAQSRA